jgi:hypothetical protein
MQKGGINNQSLITRFSTTTSCMSAYPQPEIDFVRFYCLESVGLIHESTLPQQQLILSDFTVRGE